VENQAKISVKTKAKKDSNPGLRRECQIFYDWWQSFSNSRSGEIWLFGWALAEATFWPILPDFLLGPMSVGNRRYYRSVLAAILGSALGGIILLLVASSFPTQAHSYLQVLPLVNGQQISTVSQQLTQDGVGAFLAQPWSGVAFKVWALVATTNPDLRPQLNLCAIIPIFIIARAFRMALVATLIRLVTSRLPNFIRDYSIFLAFLYLVMFFFGWWEVIS
jgi:membrane protein YqaA with SNARE-associated domain